MPLIHKDYLKFMGCESKYLFMMDSENTENEKENSCPKEKIKKVWENEDAYSAIFMEPDSKNEQLACLNDQCCAGTTLFIKGKFDNLTISSSMIKFFLL